MKAESDIFLLHIFTDSEDGFGLQAFFQNTSILGLVASFILIISKIHRRVGSPQKPSPPGPWGFPFVGYLPLLTKDHISTFTGLRKRYGDVFQLRLGCWPTVVISGKKLIRQALRDRADDFSGRPPFPSAYMFSNGESLSFGQFTEKWKLIHKVALRALSEMTNARVNPIEVMVHEEVDILVKAFTSSANLDPNRTLRLSVSSIIYQICYGRQENIREAADFIQYLQCLSQFDTFLTPGNPYDLMPVLSKFIPGKIQRFANFIDTLVSFRKCRVADCRKTFSPNHKCHVSDYLIAETLTESYLTEENIFQIIDAFFGAAITTVHMTLRWAVLLMSTYPEVQKRVQTEIDDVVGNRRPVLNDRRNLAYTEAVLHEVNRFVSLEPTALPHFTTKDTELGGYSIKKDTVVFINLYSMSRDREVWGDPDVFRPDRFLDTSGEINRQLLGEFLPFSAGRRKCMGEVLAKNKLFLFLTGLLQQVTIEKPDNIQRYSLEAIVSVKRECLPYTVVARLRD